MEQPTSIVSLTIVEQQLVCLAFSQKIDQCNGRNSDFALAPNTRKNCTYRDENKQKDIAKRRPNKDKLKVAR